MEDQFYKENPSDRVWWVDTSDRVGLFLFSFDKKGRSTCSPIIRIS